MENPLKSALPPTFRYEVTNADRSHVAQIVSSTGFFRADEIEIAVELVDERLAKSDASGYHFVFIEIASSVAGYVCYGPIACTLGSFDLYWIAVAPQFQRLGLGQRLLIESERLIAEQGGRQIYIETSSKPQYAPTRGFYERCGYHIAAVLTDFYELGDDKVVWQKTQPLNTN